MKRQSWNWGVVLVALGASLWGTDALLRTPLLPLMSSTAIVFAEHIVLALYAVPVLIWQRAALRNLTPVQWGIILAIGWGASGLATILFTEGFKAGDPTTVVLLQKTQPLFAIVLARLALSERMPLAYWPCFLVAMVGTYLVAFGSLEPIWRLPQASLTAALYALGAAAIWGAGTVMGRFSLGNVPFQTLTALRFLVALPFLLVLAIPGDGLGQTVAGLTQAPLMVALLALIPGLIGMLLYYHGLHGTRASVATLAELAFPFTAVVVGWLFLQRAPSLNQLIGFGLLWLALLALSRLEAPRPLTPTAAAAAQVAGAD